MHMKKGLSILLFIISAALPGNYIKAQEVSPYKVSRLSFNLPGFSDISPVILQDGIMFCSDRRLSGVIDRTSFDNRRLYSIYIAEKKDTSDWRKPNPVKSDRTAQFNTGPLCIAADGKQFISQAKLRQVCLPIAGSSEITAVSLRLSLQAWSCVRFSRLNTTALVMI